MKQSYSRWVAATALLAVLAGCGGGSDPVTPPPVVVPPPTVQQQIATASALAANDTAVNTSSAFTVVQTAGVPAVTVKSPPVVNFTVLSDGKVLTGLGVTNGSLRFNLAKLVPGTDGNPDQWVNYISVSRTAKAGIGPGGLSAPLATAMQATTDTFAASRLTFNADGYYTYTFDTDITDPTKTNGVVFERNRTHRIGIQLSYKNAAGETVLVNPYFDFTIDASGNSVPVTDPALTRKMADVSSCNGCHEKLAMHGGGRVDVQYCVLCHNPGTTDPESGNNLNMATMVHKLHAGKLLKSAPGGETYKIWGFRDSEHDYSHVGFPQDLRNCTKCHSGDNPATPQGGNWATKPSKEACLTCHANGAGSAWEGTHKTYAGTLVGTGAAAKDLSNKQCAECHKPGSNIAPDRVHFNQIELHAKKYKMNIESATYDAGARKVTVKYSLTDPTNGNAAYDLSESRFSSLRLILAYQSMAGQSQAVTEFSSYNNGGNGVRVDAYKGTNDGSNRYTAEIALPAETLTHVPSGTARVLTYGQIREPKLQAKWATDPRPAVVPEVLVNTGVQHAFKDVVLTGTLNPRRAVVSNDKCNACHGLLGTGTGSNTIDNAFHGGSRNYVESCVLCHDANRVSTGSVMTNGMDLNESYQFKRMVHGIHGGTKRFYPFTRSNKVVGAFCNPVNTSLEAAAACDISLTLASSVSNFTAEVAWPGVGINCNVCHVDNSYKTDKGTLGAVVKKSPSTETDPNKWLVISPKAASCTACHDSPKAIGHVTSFGSASFGNVTQAGRPQETCDDCHASGGFKGVDLVHGQK